MRKLREGSDTIVQVGTAREAIDNVVQTPSVVLITDHGIHKEENEEILQRIVSYVRAGGTVVVGFFFPYNTNADQFEAFFEAFGLAWTMGAYTRAECWPNVGCNIENRAVFGNMPSNYHTKAVYVHGAKADEKIYVDPFDLPPDSDRTEAIVARAKVGQGWLVYMGDVYFGEEFQDILLKLCGIDKNG
ncbi:uncharacterized protein LY89DRAFT_276931 [Mollisia scopiformis]|uniref:Uncharacterized protein n=1 Tax=Mollisia scopiformis TaxID=149040 RepID=A0A132BBH2_MOLSC|nr:uncharacterized protein LY89DRAFT_276931 [Mollisia scopiformis]KUJ09770.1 hypothetical protein LY89DRAFT_276931 [Mollisia scopiformis]